MSLWSRELQAIDNRQQPGKKTCARMQTTDNRQQTGKISKSNDGCVLSNI